MAPGESTPGTPAAAGAGHASSAASGPGSVLYDMYEHTNVVPTVFRWEHGGNNVFITGAFNGWSRRVPMHRSGNDFLYIAGLPKGRHAYKFIVDDEWRFAPDQPTVADTAGNINNVIDLTGFTAEDDYAPGRVRADSIPGVPWGQVLPDEDEYSKEPPFLPPHLRNIILNSGPPDGSSDPMQLQPPLHVTLKRLHCTAIKDGLMVQATTQRYRKKFVATVYYAVMPMSSSAAAAAAAAGLLPLPVPMAAAAVAAPQQQAQHAYGMAGGPQHYTPGGAAAAAAGDFASPASAAAAAGGFAAPGGAGAGAAATGPGGAAVQPMGYVAGGPVVMAAPAAADPPAVPASALPLVAASAASVGAQASGAVEALAARVAAAAAATAAAVAAAAAVPDESAPGSPAAEGYSSDVSAMQLSQGLQ